MTYNNHKFWTCFRCFGMITTILFVITIVNLIITPRILGHSYSVPENNKRAVWRIQNPDGKIGTGFVLSDPVAGFFLVTNKHVVRSKLTGKYFESVQVFLNINTKKNRTKSTDSSLTLRLRYKNRAIFVEHVDKDFDLVFIQLGKLTNRNDSVSNPSGFAKLIGWPTTMIADTRLIEVHDGTTIQLIGYSLRLPQAAQFPISRFGKISSYSAEKITVKIDGINRRSEWIIVDASVRGGHSGGPAFAQIEQTKKLVLIGFVEASSQESELTFIIPSHYIMDLLKKVREIVK